MVTNGSGELKQRQEQEIDTQLSCWIRLAINEVGPSRDEIIETIKMEFFLRRIPLDQRQVYEAALPDVVKRILSEPMYQNIPPKVESMEEVLRKMCS